MKKIKAPFTDEQIKNLNDYQKNSIMHPFTCDGTDCKDRTLIATNEGWTCVCGKYTQDWAHSFMAERFIT